VVDKGLCDSVMREEGVDPAKPVDRQALRRLGQRLGVEVVLLGTVDMADEGRKGSTSYPELSLTLRMLEVQNGEVVWQSTGHASGDSLVRRLFGLAAHDAFRVGREMVDTMLSSIPVGKSS